MTLYEIDKSIYGLIDEETGEIADLEAFENLQMERNDKIESILLWTKDLDAENQALTNEIASLTERKKRNESKRDNLVKFIESVLDGEKFKTSKVAVSYRTSTSTEVTDDFCDNADEQWLTIKVEKKPNKTAIKEALKSGIEIAGAKLVTKTNISIK